MSHEPRKNCLLSVPITLHLPARSIEVNSETARACNGRSRGATVTRLGQLWCLPGATETGRGPGASTSD